MRRKVKNEDSKLLNQTQPTSVKSKSRYSAKRVLTSKNAFLLENEFLLQHIHILGS